MGLLAQRVKGREGTTETAARIPNVSSAAGHSQEQPTTSPSSSQDTVLQGLRELLLNAAPLRAPELPKRVLDERFFRRVSKFMTNPNLDFS